MVKSTITAKNQTTVPREVRRQLGVGPKDVLLWEVVDGEARLRPGNRDFLKLRGSLDVGPGSTVEEIRRFKETRGSEGA